MRLDQLPSRIEGAPGAGGAAARESGGGRQRDDRLLAIPLLHPRGDELRTVDDVAERIRDEIAHFFTSSIFFTPKNPKLLGWAGPEAAGAMIR